MLYRGGTFLAIKLDFEDRVAHIVLDNPPSNKMDRAFFERLGEIIGRLKEDKEVRAAVIYGKGRHFSAGANLEDIKKGVYETSASDGTPGIRLPKALGVLAEIERLGFPVIAAIRGFCIGSALELALACDIRICGNDAVLGFPEITWGLITGCSGSIRAGRLIGTSRTMELILTGEFINGLEAQRIGLVNRSMERDMVLEQAFTLARSIAGKEKAYIVKQIECL